MTDIIKLDNQLPATQVDSAYDVLMYALSDASKRQYDHTFNDWSQFAEANGFDRRNLSPQNIIAYLESLNMSHSTRKARLSHLRKFVQVLHAQSPDNVMVKSWHEQLKLLQVKRRDDDITHEREGRALTPREVHQALDVWNGSTPMHRRNHAILAVAFYGGLRVSEIANLTWSCVDFEEQMIVVLHGKGDKDRTVPVPSDYPFNALTQWREYSADGSYIFRPFSKRKNADGHFVIGADKPLSVRAIRNVCNQAGFSPHDARRTLITNALNAGTSVSDAQFIAGHAKPETTLRYAKVKDASDVKARLKLNY